MEVSGYILGNKVRKLSPLQLSLEKMTPPQACICLQFHQTTDQLGPCLWGSLACSQTAKRAFAKHVSASKSLCSLNWSHSWLSCTLGMPRKLLPGMASCVGTKTIQDPGLEQKHLLMMLCAPESNFWNPNYVSNVMSSTDLSLPSQLPTL